MEVASRRKALATLEAFLPRAGSAYALNRNMDLGPADRSNTSCLSPYLQRRLVAEEEVLLAVLRQHPRSQCGKFAQEVLWRSYWKSWLERRPSVWNSYLESLRACEAQFGTIREPHDEQFRSAVAGRTGIEAFDAWRRELSETGFLHNHTRMWFASIWIFTLQLPWQLGAALFLSELLDADAASNTLSWRWVAGLHTVGKGYVATAANIAKCTNGRFCPEGELNESPKIEAETEVFPLEPLDDAFPSATPPSGRVGLLVTPEDLSVETTALAAHAFSAVACFAPTSALDARHASTQVRDFEASALVDADRRFEATWHVSKIDRCTDEESVHRWCIERKLESMVTLRPGIGFLRSHWQHALDRCEIPVWEGLRAYDLALLPLATRGYFPFLDHLPTVLDRVEAANGTVDVRLRRRKVPPRSLS